MFEIRGIRSILNLFLELVRGYTAHVQVIHCGSREDLNNKGLVSFFDGRKILWFS